MNVLSNLLLLIPKSSQMKQIPYLLLIIAIHVSCSKNSATSNPSSPKIDSTRLYYNKSNLNGNILSYEIYSCFLNGTNETKLTNFSVNGLQQQWALNPVFNGDSSKIIFVYASSYSDGKLKMMNLNGGNVTPIAQNIGNGAVHFPLFCQNGQRLLFCKDTIYYTGGTPVGYSQIFTSNLDGSNLQKITNASGANGMPDNDCFLGSVYQNKIAYLHQESPGTNGYPVYEIYTMNLDGSNKKRLTFNNLHKMSVTFSPNGTKMAVTGKVDDTKQNAHSEIFLMNSDGTNLFQLTSYSNNGSLPVRTGYPAFSKDGQTIYYSSDEANVGKASQIYKMNLDGTGKTKITSADLDSYKFNFIIK